MSKEVKIDENSYLMLINKVLKNKDEERDLALDRYRKADEAITTNDHFMLLGKNAAAFLQIASSATNDLASLAKEIKSIVFKDDPNANANSGIGMGGNVRAIIDLAKEEEEKTNLPATPQPEDNIEPTDND